MLAINRLEKALGAEVAGIKLGHIDDGAIEELKSALNEHGVLCVRDQQELSPVEQIAFANQLGTIHEHILDQFAHEGHPEILVLSNETDDDGNLIGIKDGAQYWHSDTSYEKAPLGISILRAGTLPEKDGKILGDTMFASAWKAYEA